MFTDADVHFAPDVLRRAVALATERQWDHLTLLTAMEMRGFWEITAISYFALGFVFGNEPWLASNPRSGRYVGVGAFQLVRRAAYEKSGGHRRLRMDVIEDMKVGKLMKMAGFRSGVAVAQDMVRVRWHSGVRNVIRGVTKNFFAACHYNALFASGRDDVAVDHERPAVFRPCIRYGLGACVRGIAVGVAILIHAAMIWSTDASPLYALTHPLGALLFLLDAGPLGDCDAMARRRGLARYVLSARGIAQGAGVAARLRIRFCGAGNLPGDFLHFHHTITPARCRRYQLRDLGIHARTLLI